MFHLVFVPKTTMKMSRDTLNRLKERGKMGDSFENVVNRLLDDTDDENLEDIDEEDEEDNDRL